MHIGYNSLSTNQQTFSKLIIMKHPDFFDAVPKINMYDPLAEFLGATENGILQYSYFDAVRFAGHSCQTITAAY